MVMNVEVKRAQVCLQAYHRDQRSPGCRGGMLDVKEQVPGASDDTYIQHAFGIGYRGRLLTFSLNWVPA